ncbi:ABC transporter permease [Streptomyces amakusaensis]|uniref:ABC transporter permease n=1 Tax=Streptomyces amakusaensis TaxID=67271 RepID=A0ABW0AF55_9ACTN
MSASVTTVTSVTAFTAVLRSESLKIRSVRSLGLTLGLVLAVTAGFSVLMSASLGPEERAAPGFDPLESTYFGLHFGQVAAVCFGALAVAGEYRGGALRVSLTAVPRRGRFYAAKLAAVALPSFAVGLVTGAVCFLAGQPLTAGGGLGPGDPGAVRAMVGCGLYLTLITLLAAGLATLLRGATAVLGLLIPLLLILPFVIKGEGLVEYLPDRAGRQILFQDPVGSLGPWAGLAVLALWTAAAVWAGWEALRRRDA